MRHDPQTLVRRKVSTYSDEPENPAADEPINLKNEGNAIFS